MMNINAINKIYTHSGVFHADEVCAVALLKILGFTGEVCRVGKLPAEIEDDAIVLDIGGKYDDVKYFDHHQVDAPVRETGVKYATFGLLVKHFGICDEPGFETFDRFFAAGIDARDNGQWDLAKDFPSPIGNVVNLFNPVWDSDVSENAAFEQAVALVKQLLELEFNKRRSAVRADSVVFKAIDESKNGVIILPTFLPWKESLKRYGKQTDVKAAIFPSRGEWVAFLISGFTFPLEWASNPPEGCNMAHKAGFMIACPTKDDVIRLCEFIEGGE